MKKLLVLLACFTLVSGCINTKKSDKPRPPLKVLQDAPEFELKNVSGDTPITSKDFKGKVVIVDFWATWCPPCKKEIPEYNEIRAKLKDQGVEFVGVTFESSLKDTQEFVKEFEMKYPVGMGNDPINVALGGYVGLPTTFVIGKDWKVYRKYLGAPPEKMEHMQKDIEELMAKDASD